eukprot:gene1070-640_t
MGQVAWGPIYEPKEEECPLILDEPFLKEVKWTCISKSYVELCHELDSYRKKLNHHGIHLSSADVAYRAWHFVHSTEVKYIGTVQLSNDKAQLSAAHILTERLEGNQREVRIVCKCITATAKFSALTKLCEVKYNCRRSAGILSFVEDYDHYAGKEVKKVHTRGLTISETKQITNVLEDCPSNCRSTAEHMSPCYGGSVNETIPAGTEQSVPFWIVAVLRQRPLCAPLPPGRCVFVALALLRSFGRSVFAALLVLLPRASCSCAGTALPDPCASSLALFSFFSPCNSFQMLGGSYGAFFVVIDAPLVTVAVVYTGVARQCELKVCGMRWSMGRYWTCMMVYFDLLYAAGCVTLCPYTGTGMHYRGMSSEQSGVMNGGVLHDRIIFNILLLLLLFGYYFLMGQVAWGPIYEPKEEECPLILDEPFLKEVKWTCISKSYVELCHELDSYRKKLNHHGIHLSSADVAYRAWHFVHSTEVKYIGTVQLSNDKAQLSAAHILTERLEGNQREVRIVCKCITATAKFSALTKLCEVKYNCRRSAGILSFVEDYDHYAGKEVKKVHTRGLTISETKQITNVLEDCPSNCRSTAEHMSPCYGGSVNETLPAGKEQSVPFWIVAVLRQRPLRAPPSGRCVFVALAPAAQLRPKRGRGAVGAAAKGLLQLRRDRASGPMCFFPRPLFFFFPLQ